MKVLKREEKAECDVLVARLKQEREKNELRQTKEIQDTTRTRVDGYQAAVTCRLTTSV